MLETGISKKRMGGKLPFAAGISRLGLPNLGKFLFICLALLMSLAPAGWVGDGLVMAADVEVNPGDTEPVKDIMLFQDDEFFVGSFTDDGGLCADILVPTSDDLKSWDGVDDIPTSIHTSDSIEDEYTVADAASGRIVFPARDIFVWAHLSPIDAKTYVELAVPYSFEYGPHSSYGHVTLRGPKNLISPDERYIAVAAGDLDRFVDKEGFYHDEIIVVRSALHQNTGEAVMVDVLDYNLNVLASYDFPGSYKNVDVILEDFNGDLTKEIAIAMASRVSDKDIFVVTTGKLNYNDTSKQYSLAFHSTSSNLYWSGYSVDLASGDFRGKGTKQIIASGGRDMFVFETDANLALSLKTTKNLNDYYSSPDDTKTKVKLAAGLFHFEKDPGKGYGLNRRQLAAVGLKRDKEKLWIKITTFDMDENYNLKMYAEKNETLDDHNRNFKMFDLSVVAGNFVGHGQSGEEESPAMQLGMAGYGFYGTGGDHENCYFWRVYTVSSDLKTVTKTFGGKQENPHIFRAYFALRYDYDGDTWRVGPPVQVTMDHIIQLEGMIEEPPKHVDYAPVEDPDKNPETEWEVWNIGGFDEFNVETSFTDGKSLESITKSTTSWDIGAAASFDASLTFKAGVPLLGKTKIEGSIEAKAGYQYEASTAHIDSLYGEIEAKVARETNRDDNIGGHLQRVDVWLYPILGYMTGDDEAPLGYYQVVIPGVIDDNDPDSKFESGGFTHGDSYQPLHENHNILSYPDYSKYKKEGKTWPEDIGKFTAVIDPIKGPQEFQTLFNQDTYMTPIPYEGNAKIHELTFTGTVGDEDEREYNNTFSEEAAIGFKTSSQISIPFEKTKLKMEGKLSFDSSQSWGGSHIGKQETSKAKGLKITIPANEENVVYSFITAVYTSSNGGAFRVAHAVDPLGSDTPDWWKIRYGRKPDPALNLPHRFTHQVEGSEEPFKEHWTLSKDFDKNYMRGFILKEGEINPVSGKYSKLSGTIYDGDVVQLCARVYNYSLSKDTGSFDVTFYYVLWDNKEARIVPGHEWETQPGMTTTIHNLNGTTIPYGTSMTEACVFWDTKDLSKFDTPSGSEYGYRFMVHLDEKNQVDEIHEGWRHKDNEDEERPGEGIAYGPDAVQMPAGNNVGTWPSGRVIHVAARSESLASLAALNIPEQTRSLVSRLTSGPLALVQSDHNDQDVTFSEDSLSIKIADEMKSAGEISLEKGQKYQLRAHIKTETRHLHSFFVKFYDGDPRNGGKLIGMQPTSDLPAGDAYVWAVWAPETIGVHRIWAQVIGDLRYTDKQDTWEFLDVTVKEKSVEPEPISDSSSSGCFISTIGD